MSLDQKRNYPKSNPEVSRPEMSSETIKSYFLPSRLAIIMSMFMKHPA
jgi:hypothetical protein